ncbi:MAG: c-type cytochrome [Thermodesulfovibrionales bacterium]
MRSIIMLLLLSLSFLIACSKNNPFIGNREAIKEGAVLYKNNCERCHGPEGSGGVCPNLTDRNWIYGGRDGDIFSSISSGRPGGMPAWKGILKKEEIWKIIAYIRTLEK